MTEYNEIVVPYGFCARHRCVCPRVDEKGCGIYSDYSHCASFRESGKQRAIEEVDEYGQRRIYLATAQGVYLDPATKTRLRDSSQGQAILGSGVGNGSAQGNGRRS